MPVSTAVPGSLSTRSATLHDQESPSSSETPQCTSRVAARFSLQTHGIRVGRKREPQGLQEQV